MSNINDIVRSAQGGQAIENLSNRLGLASWQTEAAVQALIPALSAGLRKATEDPASLRALIAAASDPQSRAAYESAEAAYSDAAVEGGAEIVDHLFGSPATTGQIAQLASRESNVRADVLQQLLPVLAAIVAGGLHETFDKDGRAILGRLGGEEPAAAPVSEDLPEIAAPRAAAGGLAAFLSGVVATLFGGKPAPQAAGDAPSAAAPKGNGLDADSLQEALEQIRKAFAPGASVSADHQASLDDVLGQVFGSPKG